MRSVRFIIELDMPLDETTAGWSNGTETARSIKAVLHEIPTDHGDVVVPVGYRISLVLHDDDDPLFLTN